jgi:hypothetical protein
LALHDTQYLILFSILQFDHLLGADNGPNSRVRNFVCTDHTWTRSRSNACVLRSRSERERDRKDFENLERERTSSLTAAFNMRSKKGKKLAKTGEKSKKIYFFTSKSLISFYFFF